jgi:hypothetical protein
MRWAEYVARNGGKMNAYRLFMEKSEGKLPLGRPRHRWVGTIEIDLLELGLGDMDFIDLTQDRGK